MDGIHKSLFIDAPRDKVWQCLTRSVELEKWMCTTPEGSCREFKLAVGSTIILADPPSGPWDGKMIWHIVALEEPKQIEFSFFHNLIGEETQLIFKLQEEVNGTRFQLLHSGFENTVGDGIKNRDDHDGGWKDHMDRLKAQSEAH